jgi:hypothetical protein
MFDFRLSAPQEAESQGANADDCRIELGVG